MSSDLRDLLDFATEIAWQAGRITLRYYQTGVGVEAKADDSPVTIADREAENLLRDLIRRHFPDDGIVGEEWGEIAGRSGRRWIVDPIDGTKSFIHGVPIYAVLIGLEIGEECVVGAASFPALNEMVCAAKGMGCFWNGRRASVSGVSRLSDALLLTTDFRSVYEHDYGPGYDRVVAASKLQRGWGDAYGHALVATGRAEVMLDPIMEVWDCAALVPIVLEAGGTFTDWKGNTTARGRSAISTNGKVYEEVMGLLAQ
ncbi:MAG: histidinol-phosphatase [Candidatus Latescibacteria bacterium]|nr:histidinol-phosphatase [Candidatus Latescibacterota bacterium]